MNSKTAALRQTFRRTQVFWYQGYSDILQELLHNFAEQLFNCDSLQAHDVMLNCCMPESISKSGAREKLLQNFSKYQDGHYLKLFIQP
jgi:hypothetical protein